MVSTAIRTLIVLATACAFVSAAPAAVRRSAGHDDPSSASAQPISPLGCIGIPVHADDSHADACREWFQEQKQECASVDQAISTAKCVIGRLQSTAEAEQASMCKCMDYYEAMALSVLATEHGEHGDDDDDYNYDADDDDASSHDGSEEEAACSACHNSCPDGDSAAECHSQCDIDGCSFDGDETYEHDDTFFMTPLDYEFEVQEEALHQCHDGCDSSFCAHLDFDGSGSGGEDAALAATAPTEEPMRGRRFEEEHDLLNDPCYTCHTQCIEDIFGSGFFGSGSGSSEPIPPMMDEHTEQCHADCEGAFPMTNDDWWMSETSASAACQTCQEACASSSNMDENADCNAMCDETVCGTATEHGDAHPTEATAGCHECHEACANPEDHQCHLMCDETSCPMFAADADAQRGKHDHDGSRPRRSVKDLRANAVKSKSSLRSRRFSENMQCHVDCDGGGHHGGMDEGIADAPGGVLGDAAVGEALDAIESEVSSATAAGPASIATVLLPAAVAAALSLV